MKGGDPTQPPLQDDDSCLMDDTMIDQLDGNISVSSYSDLQNVDSVLYPIPVQTGHRPSICNPSLRLPPVRKTIRRDNKVLQAVTLPKMSNYNMRSLMPKLFNFGTDMEDRCCSISFLTEVWQKAENKKHQFRIEELFEMRGLKYISTPRPGTRRGGGAAIVVNTENFQFPN